MPALATRRLCCRPLNPPPILPSLPARDRRSCPTNCSPRSSRWPPRTRPLARCLRSSSLARESRSTCAAPPRARPPRHTVPSSHLRLPNGRCRALFTPAPPNGWCHAGAGCALLCLSIREALVLGGVRSGTYLQPHCDWLQTQRRRCRTEPSQQGDQDGMGTARFRHRHRRGRGGASGQVRLPQPAGSQRRIQPAAWKIVGREVERASHEDRSSGVETTWHVLLATTRA